MGYKSVGDIQQIFDDGNNFLAGATSGVYVRWHLDTTHTRTRARSHVLVGIADTTIIQKPRSKKNAVNTTNL